MKRLLTGVLCMLLLVVFTGEAFSATKKKRRRRSSTVSEPATTTTTTTTEQYKVEVPKPEGWWDKFEVAWSRGLQFTTSKFSMKFRIRSQFRYEYNALDDVEDNHTFRIRRFKLSWDGFAFTKNFEYKLQVNFAAGSFQDMLEDVTLNYKFYNPLQVTVGQYKVPYNRQELTSSGRQQFVDRSLASGEFQFASADPGLITCDFGAGNGSVTGSGITCGDPATQTRGAPISRRFARDVGIMVHGSAWDKKLEYNLSVTNGAGFNRLNANQELLYIGRAVWNPLGYYGYSESDILDSQSPNLTFGANGGYQVQDFTSTKFFLAGADVGFKYKGFSFAGEYFFRNNDPVGTAATTRDHGYYAQAGYFIIPRHFEVAARSSQVFLGGANNNRSEFMGGLNYFIFGHDLKLQADYAFLPRQVNPTSNAGDDKKNDHRFRIQLQSWF